MWDLFQLTCCIVKPWQKNRDTGVGSGAFKGANLVRFMILNVSYGAASGTRPVKKQRCSPVGPHRQVSVPRLLRNNAENTGLLSRRHTPTASSQGLDRLTIRVQPGQAQDGTALVTAEMKVQPAQVGRLRECEAILQRPLLRNLDSLGDGTRRLRRLVREAIDSPGPIEPSGWRRRLRQQNRLEHPAVE